LIEIKIKYDDVKPTHYLYLFGVIIIFRPITKVKNYWVIVIKQALDYSFIYIGIDSF